MDPFNDDDLVPITISAKSKRILDQYTLSGQISGTTLRPDGRYEVKVQRQTVERLRQVDPDTDVAIASLEDQMQRCRRKQ